MIHGEERKKRKFLVVLNYYVNDRDMAKAVAELISDLEAKKNDGVDFLFFRRWDSEKMPVVLINRLQEKFDKVHELKCRRMNAVGYPYGPNEMFYDLLERMSNNDWRSDYYAFLNMEADCCPLNPDWLDKLIGEYDAAYQEGKSAIGHIVNDPRMTHLNGAAIYSTDFWFKAGSMNIIGGPANVAYDIHHAQRVLPICKDSPYMLLDFNRKTITEDDLFSLTKGNNNVRYFHGVKDMSAIYHVRNRFITPTNLVSGTALKLKTICTYQDQIADSGQREQNAILELWKETWKRYGYNPVVFTEWDASKNPLYTEIRNKLKGVGAASNRKLSNALIYRWLALEHAGGGFFTEYDVFPGNNFTSDDLPRNEAVNLLDGGQYNSMIADRRGLKFLTEWIKDAKMDNLNEIPTDKEIMKDAEEEFWIHKHAVTVSWNASKWAEAKLVHFSRAACRTVSGNPNKYAIIEQYVKTLNP